jgi:hypothetical protein
MYWQYPMEVSNYNNLAGEGFVVARYLFLIVVPDDVDQYAHVDENALRLRHCGYWASLRDLPVIDEKQQKTVTVRVPKRNVLTVSGLRALLQPMPIQRVPAS